MCFCLGLAVVFCARALAAPNGATLTLADFETGSLAGWTTSMSPDYYKGEAGMQGLQIVSEAGRGRVLAADVRFVDPNKSEPCFITYVLPEPLPLFQLRSVSFWYRLADCSGLESFKVRLRTSDTEFNDYEITPTYGRWAHCVIDPKRGGYIRNIWGKLFDSVKQLTFRLDDIDTQNAHFTLFVDDIVVTLERPREEAYTPRRLARKQDERLDVLLIRHAAASASTYWLEQAWRTLDPQTRVRAYPFKGLHFCLDLYGFPRDLDRLLNTDLIVFLDVDPFILTTEQAGWIADLVYSGAGLLFYGGNETLARSRDFKRALQECLPATFLAGDPAFVDRKARIATPHFVTAGLENEAFGIAHYVQRLEPKAGAIVAVAGEERPIVLLREFGAGRVALVNAQPRLDDEEQDFFAQPAVARLTQRLQQWLLRREADRLPAMALERDLPPATPPPVTTLKREGFFPIITVVGWGASGHFLGQRALEQEVEAVRQAGFNTIAVGGLSALAQLPLDARPSAYIRNIWALQRFAAEKGLATIYEYTSFHLVGHRQPTRPCVFSPDYPQALAAKLLPQIEVAKRTPNLLSVKVLDEPTISPAGMDYCEHCQRVFRERYGMPLRRFEEIPPEAIYERWAFADFMGFYVAEGYRRAYELKQQAGATFDLLLTYMSAALGFGRPLTDQEDALDWGRYADRLDFDVYPYFYPDSQKIRMLRAAYCMAYMRAIARHLGKPWGFYIELDDRNWPFQQNPREASAECAYEALLHGADYLNSFIHLLFGTGNDARPERWAWTAQELRKIRAVGPLLTRLARPPAPVAFLYPTAQTFVRDQAAAKPYAFACISQGFGEADILPEEVALEQKAIHYKALFLLGSELLHADMWPLLEAWIRAGGTLILDRVPRLNHRGEPLQLPVTFQENGIAIQIYPLGQGKIVRLGFDLEQQYREAIEGDKPQEAVALRQQMARLLQPLQPHVVVNDPVAQMEAGVRADGEQALVFVVNHAGEMNSGIIRLRGLSFRPTFARWLFADQRGHRPIVLRREGEKAYRFQIQLPGRQAAMILLAAKPPAILPRLER